MKKIIEKITETFIVEELPGTGGITSHKGFLVIPIDKPILVGIDTKNNMNFWSDFYSSFGKILSPDLTIVEFDFSCSVGNCRLWEFNNPISPHLTSTMENHDMMISFSYEGTIKQVQEVLDVLVYMIDNWLPPPAREPVKRRVLAYRCKPNIEENGGIIIIPEEYRMLKRHHKTYDYHILFVADPQFKDCHIEHSMFVHECVALGLFIPFFGYNVHNDDLVVAISTPELISDTKIEEMLVQLKRKVDDLESWLSDDDDLID